MLYPRTIGHTFSLLPEPLQIFHSVDDSVLYKGHVTVSHGNSVGRLLARSGGMPFQSGEMPFSFRATRDGQSEIWERKFGTHMTRSIQTEYEDGVIIERVGTSEFLMQPEVQVDELYIPITGLRAFGLPLPLGVLKSCHGVEGVTEDGKITFDVHCTLRVTGLVVRYQGVMDGPH